MKEAKDLGIPIYRRQLLGKPNIGVTGKLNAYSMEPGTRCCICGMRATNAHHVVPLSTCKAVMLKTEMGSVPLFSPLFAVCGMGNASGCHGKLHSHDYELRWVWDVDDGEEKWEKGWFIANGIRPGSDRLYEFGHYEINGVVV